MWARILGISMAAVSLLVGCGEQLQTLNRHTIGEQEDPGFRIRSRRPKALPMPSGLSLVDTGRGCPALEQAVLAFYQQYLPELEWSKEGPCKSTETAHELQFAVARKGRSQKFAVALHRQERLDPFEDIIHRRFSVDVRHQVADRWQPLEPNQAELIHGNLSHLKLSLSEWLDSSELFWTRWRCETLGREFDASKKACVLGKPVVQDPEGSSYPQVSFASTKLIGRGAYLVKLANAVIEQLISVDRERWLVKAVVQFGRRTTSDESNTSGYLLTLQFTRDPVWKAGATGVTIPSSLDLIWWVRVLNEADAEKGLQILSSHLLLGQKGEKDALPPEWNPKELKRGIFHPGLVHLGPTLKKILTEGAAPQIVDP